VAEFAAFEAGDIDIVDWPLDPTHVEQYSQAPDNETIILAKFNEIGMYEFDVQNNETIQARPGVKTATSDMYFRTALACLADKDYIVTNILGGYAARLDGPIMPWMGSYFDPDVHAFSYDPVEAARYLALGGFTDSDSDGIINYPVDWPGRETGPNLDPLIFYIRADDIYRRKPAGEDYVLRLEAAGIPVDDRVVPRAVTAIEVMQEHNFDLYTGGWSLSRDPDWMYYLYHIDFYWHPGPDYDYNHFDDPILMGYLEDIAFATTIGDAVTATHNAQKRGWNAPDDAIPGVCVHIPLWATSGYTAYRRPMAYAVNSVASGTTNGWTMLVSYNTTNFYGHTIRWGFKSDVQMLNPLYSNWVWDNYVLAEIFDGTLAVNPYNLALDMPWVASGFETTTYLNGTDEFSRVILTIRDGVTWHDGTPLTANDVKFSYDYIKNYTDCWLYSAVVNVAEVNVVGNQVIIDYDVLTVWALHWSMGIYLLPKHIYETIPDPHGFTPGDLPAEDVLIGNGPYKWYLYESGEYFTLLANRDYFKELHPVGDVNLDQVVDIYDIIHVAASFGLARGETGYDITADVIAEWDLVDIYDLILVAGQFGNVWAPV
jgi:ABC-type transport system substrate-binding protein